MRLTTCLALAFATLAVTAAPAAAARPAPPFALVPSGGAPVAGVAGPIELADLDGDGARDVVTAAFGRGAGVTALLSDGAGHLRAAPGPPAADGLAVTAFATGDVDGDGKVDVAAITGAGPDARLEYARGNGAGGFTTAARRPWDEQGWVAIADVDGNGRNEILASSRSGFDIRVSAFLNGLDDPMAATTSPGPFSKPALLDADRDGHVDLVGQSGDRLPTYLGDGAGHFATRLLDAPRTPDAAHVAVGDLDEDGRVDVVTAGPREATASRPETATRVFLRRADGRLEEALGSGYLAPGGSRGVATADLDGDGHLDVVTALSSGVLAVRLGDGRGLLRPLPGPAPAAFTGGFDGVAATDLDRDGRVDVVATSATADRAVVFLNQRRRAWTAPWIAGPRRCVKRGGRARYVVRGPAMASVTYRRDRTDGGVRKIVTKPNAGHGGYAATFSTSGLTRGKHLVRAFVRLVPDDGERVITRALHVC